MCHDCPELKLLNDFFISVQLLIKALLIKKPWIQCQTTSHFSLFTEHHFYSLFLILRPYLNFQCDRLCLRHDVFLSRYRVPYFSHTALFHNSNEQHLDLYTKKNEKMVSSCFLVRKMDYVKTFLYRCWSTPIQNAKTL